MFRKSLFILAVAFMTSCAGHMLNQGDAKIKASVVKITNNIGECSGEQIIAASGQQYVLTAAHCKDLADQSGRMSVETEDGRHLLRRVIAEDPNSDLLLIEGVPNLPAVKVAKRLTLHVRTYTHGNNFKTFRTDGLVVEVSQVPVDVSENADDCNKDMPKYQIMNVPILPGVTVPVCFLVATDTIVTAMVVPGSSGGLVVDPQGDMIGVVSAGDGNFGILVSLGDIHKFLANY